MGDRCWLEVPVYSAPVLRETLALPPSIEPIEAIFYEG